MDLYAENILDHYRHPRSKQALANASVTHAEINLSCGDEITVDLLIDGGAIKGIGWQGSGCAISQAAMSMLSEELLGKSVDDLHALRQENIYLLLGVPVGPRRTKCALLCLHTLKNALRKFSGKNLQGWTETVGDA